MKQFILPLLVLIILIAAGIAIYMFIKSSDAGIQDSTLKEKPESYTTVPPPGQPVKLIFIHHSTGTNWLKDTDGGLGMALRDNNYFVSDTNYGWGPVPEGGSDPIGSLTDIGNWWQWLRGPDSAGIMDAVYRESRQNASYSRLVADPGGNNTIIMFKSCFPNSNLRGNPDDPVPAIGANPLIGKDTASEYHTYANAKGIYQDLLPYFRNHPETLFVVVTAPPVSDATWSANARAFNEWMVNGWLKDYPYKNVVVFDLYNVLTTNGGNSNVNDLFLETGNHHRWWNGEVRHTADMIHNTSAYPVKRGDDHPSRAGNRKATEEFVSFLNHAWSQWQAGYEPASSTPGVK